LAVVSFTSSHYPIAINLRKFGVTKQELIDFEEDIKNEFLAAKIRAPVHLSRGNEDQLIEIFKQVGKHDWVFSTHRSHFHALLKGISPEWVKSEIIAGRSIHLMNREHKFFTSAIVGGNLPIAIGVAMALKGKKSKNHVWVFVGDMAGETGIFYECSKYAGRQNLPITFIIEDNGLSTNTPTQEVWGNGKAGPNIIKYSYERGFPHINVGVFVIFS